MRLDVGLAPASKLFTSVLFLRTSRSCQLSPQLAHSPTNSQYQCEYFPSSATLSSMGDQH